MGITGPMTTRGTDTGTTSRAIRGPMTGNPQYRPQTPPAPTQTPQYQPQNIVIPESSNPLQTMGQMAQGVVGGVQNLVGKITSPQPVVSSDIQTQVSKLKPEQVSSLKVGDIIPGFQPTAAQSGQLTPAAQNVTPQQKQQNLNEAITRISSNYPQTTQAIQNIKTPSDPSKMVTDAWEALKAPMLESIQRGQAVLKPSQSLSEYIGKYGMFLTGEASVAFSPISALIAAGSDLPKVGNLVRLLSVPFVFLGEGAPKVSNKIIDELPLSPKDKANLKPAVGEAFALAAQIALGHFTAVGGKKVGKYVKATSTQLLQKLTKDIITEYKLPMDVSLTGEQIRDIHQTGKLTTPEQKQFISDLKATGKLTDEAYNNLVKSGSNLDVKIPAQEIITMVDKPYWVKIRKFLGRSPSKPTMVSSKGGVPTEGSVEQRLESLTGWSPGDKARFDMALMNKDAATVKDMLPSVPQEYQTKFASNIEGLIGSTREGPSIPLVSGKLIPREVKTGETLTKELPPNTVARLAVNTPTGRIQTNLTPTEQKFFYNENQNLVQTPGKEVLHLDTITTSGVGVTPKSIKGAKLMTRAQFLKEYPEVQKSFDKFSKSIQPEKVVEPKPKEIKPTQPKGVGDYGSISPTTSGKFVAYDPVRQERLYEPGKGVNIKMFNTQQEAQAALDKLQASRTPPPTGGVPGEFKSAEKFVKARNPDLENISIYEKGNELFLENIEAKTKGGGAGTKAMEDLLNYADSKGKTISLVPGNERVDQWYGKLGFNPEKTKDGYVLVRKPQSTRVPGEGVKGEIKPKEVVAPESKELQSRVFERMKAEHPDALTGELGYDKKALDEDYKKATDLIAKDKQEAFRVAMNETPSDDVLSTSVNIAMAEKALQEGNHELFAKLINNRSLAQTRRGQEIVAEKGSVSDNSTSRYVKELIATRLENVGSRYLSGLKGEKISNKENATRVLDRKVTKLETDIKRNKLDVKTALKLLDELKCV